MKDSQIGAVCERVTRHSHKDVWVVKHVPKEDEAVRDTILVGIDGSPQSFGGLETAIEMAKRFNKKLELISEYPMVDFVDHKLLVSLERSINISLTGVIDKLTEIYTKVDLHKNQLPETPRGVVPHLTKIASLLRVRNIKYSVVTESKICGGVCPRGSKYIIFERTDYK